MVRDFSLQSFYMGLLAAFTGFAGSFAVVLQGLTAVGASEQEAASGLTVLAIAFGLCAILASVATKMPISMAWSTPGAAFLVSTGALPGGFPVAVGAFVTCALLIVLAGLWRPFGRAVAAIPAPLANAMLAGVLLGLCLAPFKAIAFDPWLGLPIVVAWIVVGQINRLMAVPAALVAFVFVVVFGVEIPEGSLSALSEAVIPEIVFVMPAFSLAGLVGIAVPLFIVTMASQNITGIAVLKANNYDPKPGPLFTISGLFSLVSAPLGGHAVNLAAIVAALCAGEESNRDPAKRYWAAIVFGVASAIFGLFAGVATAFFSLAPTILIEAVAGLALIGAFLGATIAAFKEAESREAAAVTFLITASGLTLVGISGAFWGLIAGGLMMALSKLWNSRRSR